MEELSFEEWSSPEVQPIVLSYLELARDAKDMKKKIDAVIYPIYLRGYFKHMWE